MNKRLKEIRLDKHLSQEEFGKRIGIESRGHISSLENGSKNITDRIINDVCREFNVNEDWLRNNNGDMYNLPIDEDMTFIESLMTDKNNPFYDLIMKTLKTYNKLSDENKKVVKSFAQSLITQENEKDKN